MITRVCEAIEQRKIIEFQYDNRFRVVEPYCVGESSRGNVVLRAYQIEGESSSGNPIGWKLFDLSKLSNLTITSRKFSLIQPDYNPNDRGMVKIICNL